MLGRRWKPLKAFAEEVCRVLKDKIPTYIADQIIRVDFFQHPVTKKCYVNEIESKLGNVDKLTKIVEKYEFNAVPLMFV